MFPSLNARPPVSGRFDYDINVTTNTALATQAINAGWNGVSRLKARFTIASGVTIGPLTTGSWPSNSFVELVNAGGIQGAGAATKTGTISTGAAGNVGGDALTVTSPLRLNNSQGTISGGGGGGASGDGDGATITGGDGGQGRGYGQSSASGTTSWTIGGNGGTFGASGTASSTGQTGGAAGKSVNGVANVTWISMGTLVGTTA